MTVATHLELLDLRHFSARQLRPLLEREAQVWQHRLRWDYSGSTELLLQYLDTRALPGFVALDRGRIRGFTFCVHEGDKAVIGDAFAFAEDEAAALAVSLNLLEHLLALLLHMPTVDRIESQLLLFDAGAVDDAFRPYGFLTFPRRFLERELAAEDGTGWSMPGDLTLTRWVPEDYNPAAELIHLAYRGHTDSLINDQYRTLHGSLRFLHNVVRFPGCGVFAPEASWVLRERSGGAPVGVVLCSNVGDRTAHVTQLCIAPEYRGRGLARGMMHHSMTKLVERGFAAVTLTVTEANREAMRLYDDLGFTTRHRFDAMVLEKRR